MASILLKSGNEEKSFTLYKRITAIGQDDDIKISSSFSKTIGYIHKEENGFSIIAAKNAPPILINDLPVKNYKLQDNDSIIIDKSILTFKSQSLNKINYEEEKLTAYKKLVDFSLSISKEPNIESLLKTLLKEIISIIKAEYGFLVLLENQTPKIKVEQYSPSQNKSGTISDSIVKKALEQKGPIIVSDALNDEEFSKVNSVIAFKLTSIMCVPLIYQGETLGAIYVGNNSFVNAFNHESLEIMTIFAAQASILVQNALHINALKDKLELSKFDSLVGSSLKMQELFKQIEKLAQADLSCAIIGQEGCGKSLIAKELHNNSQRKSAPFIAFSSKGLLDELIEIELFGSIMGYNNIKQTKIGKIQNANNGTIFIKDIEDLPIKIQDKLFYTFYKQKISKIGEKNSENINTKFIISAKNNFETLLKENKLSKNLYDYFNQFKIMVPSLNERKEDILILSNYFLEKFNKLYNKNIIGFNDECKDLMLKYDWPLNVKELENRVKRAVVMCENNKISKEDLDIKNINSLKIIPLTIALENFKKEYVEQALKRNQGNKTKAAQELQIDPRTIFRYLESQKNV